MSDLILRSTTRAQVAGYSTTMAIVEFSRRAVERFKREQTGQDMVEYAGVIVVVALIIAAVAAVAQSQIGTKIVSGVTNEIASVFSSGSSGGKG